MENNQFLPKKTASGPQVLDAGKEDEAPEWEDLSDEQKAQYGSPMKYARKLLERSVNSRATKGDDNWKPSY